MYSTPMTHFLISALMLPIIIIGRENESATIFLHQIF